MMDAAPVNHVQVINGKAYILSNGRRLKAKVIAATVVRGGVSIEETMAYYELTRSEVHAALAYYYDNQEAIEQAHREAEEYLQKYGISSDELKASIRARQQNTKNE
jgi:uncharacterized protein (DUF433 family)